MSYLLYKIMYGSIRIITLLPFRYLLPFSSIFYFFIYYIFPYRKKIVRKNLKNSFPEWNKKKVKQVMKKFYMHLCTGFIESLYSGKFTIDDFQLRYKVINPELCNEYFKQGKSISLMMAHYANWEWAATLQVYLKHQILPIYKPLHNPYIDRKVKHDRERFGCKTVPQEKILRKLIDYESEKKPTITYFLADQRPLMAKIQYWTTFLNQDTPVVMGPEKIARKFKHAVVFLKVVPVGKSIYEVEFVPMFDDASEEKEYAIIEKYHEILENLIREEPEYWLWTHNRWKHKIENYYKLRKNKVVQ